MADDAKNDDGGEWNITARVLQESVTSDMKFTFSPDTTIATVKSKILDKLEGVSIDRLRIIFHGRVLRDADTLQQSGVLNGNVIHVVVRSNAPPPPPTPTSAAQSTPSSTGTSAPGSGPGPGQGPQVFFGAQPFDPAMLSSLAQNMMSQIQAAMTRGSGSGHTAAPQVRVSVQSVPIPMAGAMPHAPPMPTVPPPPPPAAVPPGFPHFHHHHHHHPPHHHHGQQHQHPHPHFHHHQHQQQHQQQHAAATAAAGIPPQHASSSTASTSSTSSTHSATAASATAGTAAATTTSGSDRSAQSSAADPAQVAMRVQQRSSRARQAAERLPVTRFEATERSREHHILANSLNSFNQLLFSCLPLLSSARDFVSAQAPVPPHVAASMQRQLRSLGRLLGEVSRSAGDLSQVLSTVEMGTSAAEFRLGPGGSGAQRSGGGGGGNDSPFVLSIDDRSGGAGPRGRPSRQPPVGPVPAPSTAAAGNSGRPAGVTHGPHGPDCTCPWPQPFTPQPAAATPLQPRAGQQPPAGIPPIHAHHGPPPSNASQPSNPLSQIFSNTLNAVFQQLGSVGAVTPSSDTSTPSTAGPRTPVPPAAAAFQDFAAQLSQQMSGAVPRGAGQAAPPSAGATPPVPSPAAQTGKASSALLASLLPPPHPFPFFPSSSASAASRPSTSQSGPVSPGTAMADTSSEFGSGPRAGSTSMSSGVGSSSGGSGTTSTSAVGADRPEGNGSGDDEDDGVLDDLLNDVFSDGQ